MIRLGLRLALSGGRGAAIGLALTAFAVAVGTAILLFALSFLPALDDRAERAAWRTSFILSESRTTEGAGMLIRSDVDSPATSGIIAGIEAVDPGKQAPVAKKKAFAAKSKKKSSLKLAAKSRGGHSRG